MTKRLATLLAATMLAVVSVPTLSSAAPLGPVDPSVTNSISSYSPAPERPVSINRPTTSLGWMFGQSQEDARIETKLSSVDVSAEPSVASAIDAYYREAHNRMLWVTDGQANESAREVMSVLKQAGEVGLDPMDYDFSAPSRGDEAQRLATFEVTLTAKVLTFALDDVRGRIDPDQLSKYYDFTRKNINLLALLKQFAHAGSAGKTLASLTPSSQKFMQLASELQWLRSSGDGPDTEKDIAKITVAMEQLRWLPDDFGSRYVFINQAAFMAYYHDNNRLALSMRAVVGIPQHQTNFFDGTIKRVEFNPTWGVPQSIIRNEILPKLRRDPAYLDKLGWQVSVKGTVMKSADVDWSQPLENIAVVQPPGPNNALGQLKILFPNSHAIYMHDTPARDKFALNVRMFSHGCVRLADPRAMAAAVLGTSVEDVNDQINAGHNKDVDVPKQIPVYVSYFTAWPNADGTVYYFNDVYGRDTATLAAMKATSNARRQYAQRFPT